MTTSEAADYVRLGYFRPSAQALVGFLGQKRLQQRATELTGYDTEPAGQIRFAA